MSPDYVCDVFNWMQEKTGADDAATATLVLAYYVGKLQTIESADLLSHGICMGVRNGLYGTGSPDQSGLSEVAGEIADAIRDHADKRG